MYVELGIFQKRCKYIKVNIKSLSLSLNVNLKSREIRILNVQLFKKSQSMVKKTIRKYTLILPSLIKYIIILR